MREKYLCQKSEKYQRKYCTLGLEKGHKGLSNELNIKVQQPIKMQRCKH